MWVYHSAIGDLIIKRLPNGQYGLEFDGIIWESCHSPQAEADNVYCHVTGCSDWDESDECGPCDLSEWKRL